MLKFEKGDIEVIVQYVDKVVEKLLFWIEDGYDVIVFVLLCVLMVKFEWFFFVLDYDGFKMFV